MNDLSHLTAEEYQEKIGWFYSYLTERKPMVIRDLLSPTDRYGIDIGAGCGQYAEVLNRWGYKVIALEPNGELLKDYEYAKIICQGEDTPYADKLFDFSYAINTLHHAQYPSRVLREMWRISRKVIIGEINKDCRLASWYVKWFLKFDAVNMHFNTGELITLIRAAELPIKDIKLTPLLVVPNTFIWVVCE